MLFNRVAVLGVGLIGGSLALAAKKAGLVGTVVGYSKRRSELQKAVSMGVINQYALTLSRAVYGADLVILSTPVGFLEPLARAIAPYLTPQAIVTDVGSVKGALVSRIEKALAHRAFFVGGHPMAGRETSGIASVLPDLFKKSLTILTPTSKTDPKAIRKVSQLWKGIGSQVVTMDPDGHDQIMATVSHLPHLLAYALMELFFNPRVTFRPLPFAGGGLRDFTRIADSSPELWCDIFRFNKEALCEAINQYQDILETLKKAVMQTRTDESGLNGRNFVRSTKDGDVLLNILKHAEIVREKIRS